MTSRSTEEVRADLWKAINKVRGEGWAVANNEMHTLKGTPFGGYGGRQSRKNRTLCLLGAVLVADEDRLRQTPMLDAASILGIEIGQVHALEYGFEGWYHDETDPFWLLGRELAERALNETSGIRTTEVTMPTIEAVREELWKAIREVRAKGWAVRNRKMSKLTGEPRGGYGGPGAETKTLCILGVVIESHGGTGKRPIQEAASFLGLGEAATIALEAGFEGWHYDDIGGGFYALGEEIADQLLVEVSSN